MYKVQYCFDPDILDSQEDLFDANEKHPNSFFKLYERDRRIFDEFLLFLDYKRIVLSCSKDLRTYRNKNGKAFWKANKYLMGYVNAIYCFKELVNKKLSRRSSKVKAVHDEYYTGDNWYSFICDYRNYIVHESLLLRDSQISNGEPLIAITDIIVKLQSFHYRNDREERKNHFIEKLDRLQTEDHNLKGKYFLPITDVVKEVDSLFQEIFEKIAYEVYKAVIEDCIKRMISYIYRTDIRYAYTFIVNFEKKIECEPNYTLEFFFDEAVKSLGMRNIVTKEMIALFKEVGYTYFYDSRIRSSGFDNRL